MVFKRPTQSSARDGVLPRLFSATLLMITILTIGAIRGLCQEVDSKKMFLPLNIVIAKSPGRYCAWPSVVRVANGDLLVFYTETDEHLGPDGRIMCCRSRDNARSWDPPVTVYDTPIDDRESGVTQLGDGTIVLHLWSDVPYPCGLCSSGGVFLCS